MFWSVYEFPDDLQTYMAADKLQRVAFAKKIGRWQFLLLPRWSKFVNREVLVNVLNGVFIETTKTSTDRFEERYLVLYSKEE